MLTKIYGCVILRVPSLIKTGDVMQKKMCFVLPACVSFLLFFSPYNLNAEVLTAKDSQVNVVVAEVPPIDSIVPGVPGIPELLDIDDPLQGMNRAVFDFNDFITVYAIYPLSVLWEALAVNTCSRFNYKARRTTKNLHRRVKQSTFLSA